MSRTFYFLADGGKHRRGEKTGVSKLKLLCYNKEYEKTNDRCMEEMPEMWKA